MEHKQTSSVYGALFDAVAEIRELGLTASTKREFSKKSRGINDVLQTVSEVFSKHNIMFWSSKKEISTYNDTVFVVKGTFFIQHRDGSRTEPEEFIGEGNITTPNKKGLEVSCSGAITAQTLALKYFLLAKCGIPTAEDEASGGSYPTSYSNSYNGNYQSRGEYSSKDYRNKSQYSRSAPDATAANNLLEEFRTEVIRICKTPEQIKDLWKHKYATRSQALEKPADYIENLSAIFNKFDEIEVKNA